MNTSIDGANRYQLLALPLSCTRGSTVSFSVLHFDLALFALAEFRPCLLVLFNSICCVTVIHRLVRRDFWGTLFNGGPKAGHLWGVSSHTNSKIFVSSTYALLCVLFLYSPLCIFFLLCARSFFACPFLRCTSIFLCFVLPSLHDPHRWSLFQTVYDPIESS